MKKIICGFLLIGLGLSLTGCVSNSNIKQITIAEYYDMIENKEDFILYIGSATCSACQSYTPVLEKVATNYDIEVMYIDLDDESSQDMYSFINKISVTSTPTTLFYNQGEEASILERKRIEGAMDYESVKDVFIANSVITE